MSPTAPRSSRATGRCTRRSRRPSSSSPRCCRKVSSIDGVDVAICVAVPRAAGDGRLRARLARRRCSRRRCTRPTRARSPARSRRAMLAEIDVDGVVLGHSERRELFGETDRALALKVAAALDGGADADPLRRRDRGRARARRHRAQAAPPGPGGAREGRRSSACPRSSSPTSRSGRSAPAAARPPEQAQEAVAFVRALVEGFDKQAGQAVRILYGGSLKPENAEELLALPDVDGGARGRGQPRAGLVRRIVEIAARLRTP